MKYFVDFLAELKKGVVYPVYLFYGPENYLIDQALFRLKENLLPPGGEQFNYQVLDGEKLEVGDLFATTGSASFLPGRQLVVVRQPGFIKAAPRKGSRDVQDTGDPEDRNLVDRREEQQKKDLERLKADEKLFLDYLAAPPEGTCLILIAGSSVDRRKKTYKEVSRVGRVVEFSQLRPMDLKKWLAKRAREENCRLEPEAAELLLERCGRDMYTLYHEMDKLVSFMGQAGVISSGAVRELVAARIEESIFEVVDAIGLQDGRRALTGIRNLLLHKYPPPLIMGMVARQFRLLFQVKGLRDMGQSREEIMSALKLHPFVYQKVSRQCHNFNTGQLVRLIHDLVELDHRVKSGGAVFYPALETLILKICAQKQ